MPRYSNHARRRMLERGITEKDVEETLSRPLEKIEIRYGRKAACRHLPACNYVVVVLQEGGEGLIIVTVLKVDKDRVRRYGFAGVR